jgi:hypothetical protein
VAEVVAFNLIEGCVKTLACIGCGVPCDMVLSVHMGSSVLTIQQ